MALSTEQAEPLKLLLKVSDNNDHKSDGARLYLLYRLFERISKCLDGNCTSKKCMYL